MKKTLITFTALLSFVAFPVFASNMSFLNETPAKYYSDQDWDILSQAQDKALDKAPDNTRVNWSNPSTNHNGYFIPSNTTREHGQLCRRLKIYMNANGLSTMVHFHYCKIQGQWKIVIKDSH